MPDASRLRSFSRLTTVFLRHNSSKQRQIINDNPTFAQQVRHTGYKLATKGGPRTEGLSWVSHTCLQIDRRTHTVIDLQYSSITSGSRGRQSTNPRTRTHFPPRRQFFGGHVHLLTSDSYKSLNRGGTCRGMVFFSTASHPKWTREKLTHGSRHHPAHPCKIPPRLSSLQNLTSRRRTRCRLPRSPHLFLPRPSPALASTASFCPSVHKRYAARVEVGGKVLLGAFHSRVLEKPLGSGELDRLEGR